MATTYWTYNEQKAKPYKLFCVPFLRHLGLNPVGTAPEISSSG